MGVRRSVSYIKLIIDHRMDSWSGQTRRRKSRRCAP